MATTSEITEMFLPGLRGTTTRGTATSRIAVSSRPSEVKTPRGPTGEKTRASNALWLVGREDREVAVLEHDRTVAGLEPEVVGAEQLLGARAGGCGCGGREHESDDGEGRTMRLDMSPMTRVP